MSPVTAATASSPVGTAPGHPPANRPNMVSVGTIIWLSSELMFFAALFAIYFTIRSVNPATGPGNPAPLWETQPAPRAASRRAP